MRTCYAFLAQRGSKVNVRVLKGPLSEAFKSHLLIFVLIVDQLGFVVNSRVGWHAAGQPDATADGAVMADHCLTTIGGSVWLTRSVRSEEHTSELQSRGHLVCRLL